MTAPATPPADDPDSPTAVEVARADRRARWFAVLPGLLAVVAGLVLLGFGFRNWGPPRFDTTAASGLRLRVALALVLGVLALALVLRARSRWAFERVHVAPARRFRPETPRWRWRGSSPSLRSTGSSSSTSRRDDSCG